MIWSLFKILEKFEILSICYFIMHNGSNTSKIQEQFECKNKKTFKDTFSKQQTNKIVHVRDKRIELKSLLMPAIYLICFVL